MPENYPAALYIGRFQPPHAGHIASARLALERAGRLLILLGSANLARSTRQPFTPAEREWLFRRALQEAGADLGRVTFLPLADLFDPPLWEQEVRRAVTAVFGPAARPALVGLEKDISSAYLRWFPDWPRLPVANAGGLNATDIRAALFGTGTAGATAGALGRLPGLGHSERQALERFARTPTAARLRREWRALAQAAAVPKPEPGPEQRGLWVERGRLLLHRRSGEVGQGLWELPLLTASPTQAPLATFAAPGRSVRGPVVTEVYGLPATLPRLRPRAPQVAEVTPEVALSHPRAFFDDHGVIVQKLLRP